MSGIGDKRKEYRERLNLSQIELAQMIGVSNSRLSNWKKGENRPNVELLAKLCRALNVSADELLGLSIKIDLLHSERTHIQKYRTLDLRGKEIIDCSLDIVYKQKQEDTLICSYSDIVFIKATEDITPGNTIIFSLNGDVFIKEYTGEGLKPHNPDYTLIKPGEYDTI